MQKTPYGTTTPNDEQCVRETTILITAITLYYNFFIPAHANGRTPAEVAKMKSPPWLLPLIKKYREPLNRVTIRKPFLKRHNQLITETTTDIWNKRLTQRTSIIVQIKKQLEEAENLQDALDMDWVQDVPITPHERKTFMKKIEQHMHQQSFEEKKSIKIVKIAQNSFEIIHRNQEHPPAETKLGTVKLLNNRLLIETSTSTKRNALHAFLALLLRSQSKPPRPSQW